MLFILPQTAPLESRFYMERDFANSSSFHHSVYMLRRLIGETEN